jgi:glycosyltransferase involved in cell wall biosynthesis
VTLHVLPTVSRIATVLSQEQADIPRLARSIGADVVFSPANYGPLRGKNNVILLRNAFEVGAMERRWSKRVYWLAVRLLSELSFRRCRRAIVVSRHAGTKFLGAFRLAADARLEVVHHGVSGLFQPPADGTSRVPGRLLAVSDIYVQKNFETLIEAVAQLARSRPNIHLQIAGRPLDEGYYAKLQGLCEKFGVTDKVAFLGGRPPAEVAALYRHAEIFVFPSLVETFGNPLLEAMASGTPVVCSHAAALPEIAGDCALFAAPGDPGHMAEQIGRLLDEPALAHSLAIKGLARVRHFTWDKAVEATARVLATAAER